MKNKDGRRSKGDRADGDVGGSEGTATSRQLGFSAERAPCASNVLVCLSVTEENNGNPAPHRLALSQQKV
jgi:hypothetical protein